MLKKLFISKVRISILDVYMSDFNASFHVRGLVRELDEEINAVRRELLNLESAGILKSRREGNKLVYTVNKKCPILWELRSLFFKDSEVGVKIKEVVDKISDVDLVILTESFLTGEYENKTDVDMLFIGKMKVRELSSAMSEAEKDLEKQIRYSAITKEDFEFARKKKEPFLMNILEKDKIILIGKLSDLL